MAIPYSQTVAQQQAALNAANYGKTQGYNPLTVDGQLGNLTQAAFNQYGTPTVANTPTPTVGTAIPVAGLTTPPTPMVTPPPTPTGTTAGMAGFMDATTGQFKTAAESQTKDSLNQQQDTIAKLIMDIGNEGALKDQAYKDAGVDTAKANLDDFEKQLEREQLRNRRQTEALLGSGAITKEQAAPQIDALNRQSLAKQADIAILKSGASRDYQTATEIADRAVESQMAPAKARLDALKFLYDNNKEQFTKEDDQRLKKEYAKYQSDLTISEYRTKSKIDSAALANGDVSAAPAAPTSYTVTSSDTGGLTQIAQRLGISVDDLKAANPQLFKAPVGADSNAQWAIKKGDIINLPSALNPAPSNGSILGATGLSSLQFNYMTQGTSALTRLNQATREQVIKSSDDWAKAHGTDTATLQAQYKAYNDTLQKNIARNNNTQIAEQELLGTVANLAQAADEKDFGDLKIKNVTKLFAGEQVNDPATLKYAVHLNQLRTELAFYNAAVAGNTQTTLQDFAEAERIIKNGLSSGGLQGFENAIKASTEKMGGVLQGSVNNAAKNVWNLFGVAGKYNPSVGISGTINTNSPSNPLQLPIPNTNSNNPLGI